MCIGCVGFLRRHSRTAFWICGRCRVVFATFRIWVHVVTACRRWRQIPIENDSYLRSTLLPTFGMNRLEEITSVGAATWFHTYRRTAPGGANRTLSILKSMLNSAVDWGMLTGEGRRLHGGIRKNRRPPRGRLLNFDQIRRLGEALRESEARYSDDVDRIRLVPLTGFRSGEISRYPWQGLPKCASWPR